MRYIGIDPGTSGAVSFLDTETKEIKFFDTPTVEVRSGKKIKNQMDPVACSLLLSELARTNSLITIEKVAPMPSFKGKKEGEEPATMGVTSAFNFGMGFGMWIGICAALAIPYQLVHPVTWKKLMMADMGKEKDASRIKVMQLYPQTAKDLQRKKDHGRADALLMAEWARRTYVDYPTTPQVEEREPMLF